MNTKQVLLDIARQDLKAARGSLEKKLYPQAIFYLEQAVEKATKSMGLHHKIITEDDLQDIGHESIEVYIRVLENLKTKVKRFQERIKKFPKLRQTTLFKKYENLETGEFSKILDNLEQHLKHQVRQISDDELKKAFLELDEIKTEIEKMKITEEEMKNFKLFIQEIVNAIIEDYPAVREKAEKELEKLESFSPEVIEEIIESLIIPQSVCYNYLLFLSAALGPHATPSRYPFPKREHNPLVVYGEEHPLIKRFDKLTQTTGDVLNRMSKLFSQKVTEKLEILIG